MEDNINEDMDLISNNLAHESDVDYLVKNGLLPHEIQTVREIVNGFNPKKLDRYNDGIIYQAYYAAKHMKTMSKTAISKALQISSKLLDYYLETYPKLGVAIQAGYMDSIDEMKETLVSKLYESAMGTTIKNTTTSTNYRPDADGIMVAVEKTVTEHDVQTTPSVSAQLELLRRLDPAWVPKVQVDINEEITHTFKVTEDLNISVDYKKLSPTALKELLSSGKADTKNNELQKIEDTDVSARKDRVGNRPEDLARYAKKRGRPPKNNTTEIKELKGDNENGNARVNKRGKKKDS